MHQVQDISEEEISSLTQSILTRYGIDFTGYEPKSLRRRIIRVLNLFNFTSIHELWIQFLQDAKFIQVFMNEISVGMTSMFRDPILWINLKKRIELEFRNRDSISIWHSGCSTGEEVYSLAILLEEIRIREKAKALATDFNSNALEEARRGVYHKIKMVENENNYRKFNPFHDFTTYYVSDGKYSTMDPRLISHVDFNYHNLITDPFPSGFDIIFCRNVMIYFDAIAKTKLLAKFHEALNPNGYFIIGFFDTMNYLIGIDKFKLVDEEAKIFQKIG